MLKRSMIIFMGLVCFVFSNTYAQTASVSGKVTDGNQAVEGATIALVKAADSALVKTELTDASGLFSITGVADGTYKIWVTLIGYKRYTSAAFNVSGKDYSHPLIKIQSSDITLKEVNVTTNKSLITVKPDRTIVNVDAMISAAGGTALDVLEKSPGVQIDQNGQITLKGKQGVSVYIDDKLTFLSGADLENYLRSLPSSSLEQVEIMTNPPAKYDAAGNGGVINIRTKRNKVKGFNGSLNTAVTQGQLTRSNNSLNLNYRSNKINIFSNFSYNLNNSFTDLDLNRMYKNPDGSPMSYFEQNSYFDRYGNTFNLSAGADYYLSDQSTLGLVLNGMERVSEQLNDNVSNLYGASRQLDSFIVAKNKDDIHFKNRGINLNYRTKFKTPGHNFTADVDYITYRNITDQVYNNDAFFSDGSMKSSDVLSGYLPARINIYSVKADYELPLANHWKSAAGVKSSYAETDNKADYRNTIGGVTAQDYDKSNQFIYKENINAAYVNLNREWERLSVQTGLRYENTISQGDQLGNIMKPDSSFQRNYNSLFPTAYLSYKFDTFATHQLGINYGRRIDRPFYQDLNPFLYPMDKFTYYTGNTLLKPSYTQNIELSHTYKSKFVTTLSYARSKDEVNETIEINNGIYYSKPGNIGRKTFKSISFTGDFETFKWLTINVYSEFTNIETRSKFFTGQLNTSGSFWFIAPTARMVFGKGWSGELSGNYRSRLIDAQFIIQELWQMHMAVQKKINSKATIKMAFNDLFYSRIIYGEITNLELAEASWINRSDTRSVTFSLSYRFGKEFNAREKYRGGADTEKSRVKG